MSNHTKDPDLKTTKFSSRIKERAIIIRGEMEKEKSHFMVSKKVARDGNIPPDIKGILFFLLSFDHKLPTFEEAWSMCHIGRNEFLDIYKILVEDGYISDIFGGQYE